MFPAGLRRVFRHTGLLSSLPDTCILTLSSKLRHPAKDISHSASPQRKPLHVCKAAEHTHPAGPSSVQAISQQHQPALTSPPTAQSSSTKFHASSAESLQKESNSASAQPSFPPTTSEKAVTDIFPARKPQPCSSTQKGCTIPTAGKKHATALHKSASIKPVLAVSADTNTTPTKTLQPFSTILPSSSASAAKKKLTIVQTNPTSNSLKPVKPIPSTAPLTEGTTPTKKPGPKQKPTIEQPKPTSNHLTTSKPIPSSSSPEGTVVPKKPAPNQTTKPRFGVFTNATQELVRLTAGPDVQRCVLVSIDIEWWERSNTRVLEIGWSCWDNTRREIVSRHWIVEEWMSTVNGKYVPNNKLGFEFGKSEVGPLSKGVIALTQDLAVAAATGFAPQPPLTSNSSQRVPPPTPLGLIPAAPGLKIPADRLTPVSIIAVETNNANDSDIPSDAGGDVLLREGITLNSSGGSGEGSSCNSSSGSAGGGGGGGNGGSGSLTHASDGNGVVVPVVVLVGHAMGQDLKILKGLGVAMPVGIQVADTQKLAAAGSRKSSGAKKVKPQPIGLLRLLKRFRMAPTNLHNAGNDAMWTLRAALALMETQQTNI